jgi:hypothetical protein
VVFKKQVILELRPWLTRPPSRMDPLVMDRPIQDALNE